MLFRSAGGVSAKNVVRWTGATWSALGSGVDIGAECFATDGVALTVGGIFTTAGGKESFYIGRWQDSLVTAVAMPRVGRATLELSVHASRASGAHEVSGVVTLPRATHIAVSILDITGRDRASLVDDGHAAGRVSFRWDGRGSDGRACASGTYFVVARASDVIASKRVFWLR